MVRSPLGLSLLAIAICGVSLARAQDAKISAASALYVRTDSDHTTVVTPRVHMGAALDDERTRLDVVYTVDVWSSASIDIRTAATRRVTEQRDEIDVAVERRLGDLVLSGSYRYSTEYDYDSHGASLTGLYELFQKNANLALTGRAYFDRVGRAGDPGFDKASSLFSGRLSYTQLLGPDTFMDAAYELNYQTGFLSSPYRFVRFASDGGQPQRTCVSPVQMCLYENNPDSRMRHALALSARHAITWELSAGVGYRFYLDDWGVGSHTASLDVGYLIEDGLLLSAGYRFYRQSKADYYKPFYLASEPPKYYTSDKELTTMSTHRVDVQLSHTVELDDLGSQLRTLILASPSFFNYSDFPLLDSIRAFEFSLAMEVLL